MAHNVYYVEQRTDGDWAVEKPHSKRASALVDTKPKAIKKAHELADDGVVHIAGPHGKFVKCKCSQCR